MASRRDRARGARSALLAVFVAHNLEEIAFMAPLTAADVRVLARLGLPPDSYRADRFATATALLTAAVAATFWTAGRRSAATPGNALAAAAAGALGGNAVGHLLRAVLGRRYNAGTGTAPVLLLASVWALLTTIRTGGLSPEGAVGAAVLGNLLAVPAIAASLGAARRLRP